MRDDHADHVGHVGLPAGGMLVRGDHVAQFRKLCWINLIIAIPVVAFSTMFAMLLGYDKPDLPGAQGIVPVLGTVMYAVGGRPFLTGTVSEFRSANRE